MAISDIEHLFRAPYKIHRHSSRDKITIEEHNETTLIKKLTFKELPYNHFAVKMDKETHIPICKFFDCNCSLDINKGVDCILFLEYSNNDNVVILCDLKSKNDSDFCRKIKNTTAFLKYLNAIFVENSLPPIENYSFISLVCKRRPMGKSCIATQMPPSIIPCPGARLNKLAVMANSDSVIVKMPDILNVFHSRYTSPSCLY